MKEKDPLYLLFEHDFGSGPLFKNQIELVNELISTPGSSFYTTDEDTIKALRIRLKTYFSQLLSDTTKRNVNSALINSLKTLLAKKTINGDYGGLNDLHRLIIGGLKEKNNPLLKEGFATVVYPGNANFVNDIIAAKNIAVFTAREVRLEFDVYNKKSLVEFLFDDFMNSIKEGRLSKLYRFNFPRTKMCILFWRGLHEVLTRYLQTNNHTFISILQGFQSQYHLNVNDLLATSKKSLNESALAEVILSYLSESKSISVFKSNAPVFTIPTIVMNPNDFTNSKAYVMYLNDKGKDEIHKLGYEDIYNWKTYVWESLKINTNQSILVSFSESMSF